MGHGKGIFRLGLSLAVAQRLRETIEQELSALRAIPTTTPTQVKGRPAVGHRRKSSAT